MTDLASGPLFGLPLPDIWFALLFFLLGAFLFLDGFDFGAGALFARADHEERERIFAAIAPVWDGNEVWLVVFGGALFAAFPPVYATLFSRHYLLMFAILAALIVRGLAPEMYEQRDDAAWHRWWGRGFVAGSVAAPFFLGVFTGNWLFGTTGPSLPGLLVGLALVALAVADGAAYLALKTRGDYARVGSAALVAYLVLVVLTLALAAATPGLTPFSPLVLSLAVATVVLGGGYVLALRRGRALLALVLVAGVVAALVGVVGRLLYPVVDPGSGLTVSEAVVSTLPLNLMTVMAAFLVPFVVGYFAVLYRAFAGPVEAGEGYSH